MGVNTRTQTDYTTDTAAAYKTGIDDTIAVDERIAGPFAPHEQSTPDMTVRLDAGHINALAAIATEVAAQSTATLTAPSVNPRKDIVYIDDSTGTVGVATGAEAASPSDPAVPAGKVAIARINWTTSMTEIANSDLDDIRNLAMLGLADEFVQQGTTAELTAGFSVTEHVNADSGNYTPNLTTSNVHRWTSYGANRTLSNPTDTGAGVWYIYIEINGTGGYTLTLDTKYNLISGAFDGAANKVNILTLVSDGTDEWDVWIDQRP